MYTAIYLLNKVMPALARRLANHYFPLMEHETAHDLEYQDWANSVYEMSDAEEARWEAATEAYAMGDDDALMGVQYDTLADFPFEDGS